MDETISSVNPTVGGGPRGSSPLKKIILPVAIILIVLGVVFGGTTFLRSKSESIPTPTPFPTQEPTIEPSPTIEVTQTPTPTTKKIAPTPTKKPATATPTKEASTSATTSTKGLVVRVLNGSGTAGKASTAADYLKGLGYEIAGTGNADNFDYEKATITIKSSKQSLLATLKSDLSTKYEVGTTSATLASSTTEDAVVVIGKQ